MDNEEIKELLRELKEKSDGSTAVKSQVVKIHFDTPREAKKRAAAKRKAEKEARELEEEEEAARIAEQEERERAAEEAAAAAVAAAKAEAAKNFDFLLPEEEEEEEAGEEGAPEEEEPDGSHLLNLNWDPKKARGFPAEDDQKDGEAESEEEQGEGTNLWSSFKEQASSFFSDLLKSKKKKNAEKDKESEETKESPDRVERLEAFLDEEKEGEASSDLPDSASDSPGPAPENEAGESLPEDEDDAEEKRSALKKSMEDWKRRMEEPPRYNLRHARIPAKPVKEMPKLPWDGEGGAPPEADGQAAESPRDAGNASERKIDGKTADPSRPDYESDERFFTDEEDSSGKSFLKALFGGRKKKEKGKAQAEAPLSAPQTDLPAPEEGKEALSDDGARLDALISGAGAGGTGDADGGDAALQAKAPVRSIEVVNLNESANNRGIEVIDLDGQDTGPIPDLSEGAGRRRGKGLILKTDSKEKKGRVDFSGAGAFLQDHLRTILIVLAALVLVALLAYFAPALLKSNSADGTEITADEGLNIRIRQQPKNWVESGTVVLSIRTPETIRSITVDGESVGFTGDKSCEITIMATSSRLHLLVASADKERSAEIKLSYVDSEPPVVNVSEAGGLVTLSAADDSSGAKAIYYGTTAGFSEVPSYKEYTEPFSQPRENVKVSYYAVDNAGNKSVPVESSLIEAEKISFERAVYNIYPDSTVSLNLQVAPEGAFYNNLKITSSDSSVAEVGRGIIRAVGEGEAEITATADGLESAVCRVLVSTSREVTLSMIGDCTLGTDINFSPMNSFTAYQSMYGSRYFFEKVWPILEKDDGTFANMEGTLTTLDTRANKTFAFKGDPSYTDILKEGSVEVVTLSNNHSSDYGEESLEDTEENLTEAGISWCKGDTISIQDLNGVRCAFIGIYALENGLQTLDQVKSTVREAKEEGAEVIVVAFHWGAELVTTISDDQKTLAHTAIDEGATLVVGHHPHVLCGIETYKNRYIVYSLANFCFGGSASPTSYDTIIFQQTFTVNAQGVDQDDNIAIIPCHTSSISGSNNYQPTPVTGEDATKIMTTIDQLSAVFAQSYSQYMVDGTTIE